MPRNTKTTLLESCLYSGRWGRELFPTTDMNIKESIGYVEQGLGGQMDYSKRKPRVSLTLPPPPTPRFGTMAVKATFLPSIHFGLRAKKYS